MAIWTPGVTLLDHLKNWDEAHLHVLTGWIYDEWNYYPASLFVGSVFLMTSSSLMVYPWWKLRSAERQWYQEQKSMCNDDNEVC